MRKLFLAFIAFLLVFAIASDSPVTAEETKKRIAIIDSGLDMTHPILQGKVVHEVCLLDFPVCPNGQKTMEGTGAATLDPAKAADNSFYHGTQMSSIVISNNPNAEIVFIRIVPMTPKGGRASVSTNAVGNALEWVKNNSQKYNIAVVSVSMGLANKTAACASNPLVESNIVALKDLGIPAIFAVGNGGKSDRVDFPACFEPSVAVGGTDFYANGGYFPSLYNNSSSATDFYAFGKHTVAMPNGVTGPAVGSSGATALLASEWLNLAQRGLTYQEAYDLIKSSAIKVSTKKVANALVVDHNSLG